MGDLDKKAGNVRWVVRLLGAHTAMPPKNLLRPSWNLSLDGESPQPLGGCRDYEYVYFSSAPLQYYTAFFPRSLTMFYYNFRPSLPSPSVLSACPVLFVDVLYCMIERLVDQTCTVPLY